MSSQKHWLAASVMTLGLTGLAHGQSAQSVADRNNERAVQACVAKGKSQLTCRRELETTRLDAVTVFGDRPVDGAGSSALLTEEDITSVAADHPAEVLNRLPGVNIHTNSGQEHLIAIRSPVLTGGAGQGSFLVMENGVPIRAPAFGNVNMLFEVHHETAELIEVVRGPGSAKYGSNAVHGLINVLLSGPQEKGFESRLSAGSLGRYKADLIADQGYLARGALSLQSDTGWRDATGLFQAKASGQAETTLGAWAITGWAAGTFLEQETGDFIEGPDAYKDRDIAKANDDPLAYRDAWSARLGARFERKLGEGTLSLTPFARIQEMDFRQHFLPNKSFEENSQTGAGVMVRYERPLSETVELRLGTDIDRSQGKLLEYQDEPFFFGPVDNGTFPVGVHYDYTVDTLMGAIWTEVDWALTERLDLQFGLRGEAHEYDYDTDAPAGINGRFNVPADRSDSFDFVTPKFGAIYALDDRTDLYTFVARGARAPQASDLYRIQSLQLPADADVETLDSVEVGIRGSLAENAFVYDVAAYHMEKDNFFFRDADGLNVTDGSTRHQGIEAAFDWALSDAFGLRGQVSWSDQVYTFTRDVGNSFEVITDGNEIDTAPEWLGDLALAWRPTEALETELSMEYVGEYFTDPANTQSYPGHTVFNLRASYEVDPSFELFLIVRNLFDETYADRADFAFGNERYFPGEPLNATIGLRKTFR